MKTFTLSKPPTSDQVKNTTFTPKKETLVDVRAALKSSWRPPIAKKADEKQERIYVEMTHPLTKLKQGTVECAEKIYEEMSHPIAKLKQLSMLKR